MGGVADCGVGETVDAGLWIGKGIGAIPVPFIVAY